MNNIPDRLSLRDLSLEDRPREKMLMKGADALTNAELIAILIGSGNSKETAVELSQRILNDNGNNLSELSRKDITQLKKYKGIGEVKAISISAAMEIGRRRNLEKALERPSIKNSTDAYEALRSSIEDLPHEEVWVLYLNSSNKIVCREKVSSGGVALSVIDVKIIMKRALELLACAIVMGHNHPSGSLTPSQQDIASTQKIKEACKFFDIRFLDHIIVSHEGFFSFNDNNRL